MSFLSSLTNFTKNVGRGALDVFTLGGNEAGHKWGGDWYKNLLDPVEKGFGANFEAGAAGGSSILGAQGLGALGGGSGGASGAGSLSGMTPYMPTSTPNMGAAGSTLGPGGMFSDLNPTGASGAGSAFPASAGASPLSTALKVMRMMPQGGQQQPQPAQQRQNQEMQQRLLYQMFPNLRPGQPIGSAQRLGGF